MTSATEEVMDYFVQHDDCCTEPIFNHNDGHGYIIMFLDSNKKPVLKEKAVQCRIIELKPIPIGNKKYDFEVVNDFIPDNDLSAREIVFLYTYRSLSPESKRDFDRFFDKITTTGSKLRLVNIKRATKMVRKSMKPKMITLIKMQGCPYCKMAFRAIDELMDENEACYNIDFDIIDENQDAKKAKPYASDYYYVPSLFYKGKKMFEAQPGIDYETIKKSIKKVFEQI